MEQKTLILTSTWPGVIVSSAGRLTKDALLPEFQLSKREPLEITGASFHKPDVVLEIPCTDVHQKKITY